MSRVVPLIARELREQSRRPVNHWLRVLGGVLLLALTAYQLAMAAGIGGWSGFRGLEWAFQQFEGRGGALFRIMNLVLVAAIWFLAPLLTADCLSRERRDGTLGFLFLTTLRPRHIVMAKFAAHGLRAGCMFLAALPVLILPLLLGGVSWIDAAHAALLDLGCLILALAAGLYASTRWTGPRAVFFGAFAIAACCAMAWLFAWALAQSVPSWFGATRLNAADLFFDSVFRAIRRIAGLIEGSLGGAYAAGLGGAPARPGHLLTPLGLLALSLVIAGVVFFAACHSVRLAQRGGRPPGRAAAAVEWMGRSTVLPGALNRFRSLILGRAPVLWTELRTWRLRTGPWLFLLLVGMVEAWWMIEQIVSSLAWGGRALSDIPLLVATALCAVAAASGFQQERATGVLELLLTTPRGLPQILVGKMASLILLTLPALILIGAVHLFLRSREIGSLPGASLHAATGLLLAMAAGLYFSLRTRAFLTALGATLAVVIVISAMPLVFTEFLLAGQVFVGRIPPLELKAGAMRLVAVLQACLATAFLLLLHRALALRRFAPR